MKVGDGRTVGCPGSMLTECANSCQNLLRVSRLGDCESELELTVLRQQTDNMFYRVPDGKVCLNDQGELAVTKFAVEPVCLPGGNRAVQS
jgi:hypothetical protein